MSDGRQVYVPEVGEDGLALYFSGDRWYVGNFVGEKTVLYRSKGKWLFGKAWQALEQPGPLNTPDENYKAEFEIASEPILIVDLVHTGFNPLSRSFQQLVFQPVRI